MAIRKASDSNLTGKKYNDASASATKIVDVPDKPIIGASPGGDTVTPTVSFTAATTGGTATNFVVSDQNNSFTKTGASSPITPSGLVVGSSYTFKVKAVNSTGESAFSNFTNAVTISGYKLAQTYNSSTSYTVPTGVTKIGVLVVNGGNSGGKSNSGDGSSGGSGGIARGAYDYPVNAGTNYNVTVAGTGGTSSFGGLFTASAINATPVTGTVSSSSGGGGGNPKSGSFTGSANAGGASTPINLTLAIPGNGPYNHPVGGGGGGGGNYGGPAEAGQGGAGPGAGGQSNGGSGGGGSGAWSAINQGNPPSCGQPGDTGGVGGAGNGPGGGGGGGGGSNCTSKSGAGGVGAGGRIFVYEYYPPN